MGVAGWAGVADVEEGDYRGTEDYYHYGLCDGGDLCTVRYDMRSTADLSSDCSHCEWAFAVETSNAVAISTTRRPDLDPSDYNGATYNYGLTDYYGYDALAYYYSGRGWYPVTSADWDGLKIEYDWPSHYFYYGEL